MQLMSATNDIAFLDILWLIAYTSLNVMENIHSKHICVIPFPRVQKVIRDHLGCLESK